MNYYIYFPFLKKFLGIDYEWVLVSSLNRAEVYKSQESAFHAIT